MPRYNYTVANKDGKKLSGTVDAPNEKLARTELNNLGFSVLSLKESKAESAEKKPEQGSGTKFVFEAIDKNNKAVTGTIASPEKEKAFKRLQTEYNLTVTAIWPQHATEEQIAQAKKEGTQQLHAQLAKEIEAETAATDAKNYANEKKSEIVKNKIENLLTRINKLLIDFDAVLEEDQKALINKKINKLLRIKNSTNLDYILKTAEELLEFVEKQEKTLKEKGLQEKRLELKMETKNMLRDLNKKDKAASLSEDIVTRIEEWEEGKGKSKKEKGHFMADVLNSVKEYFRTPEEILSLEEQIRLYNKQIMEFIFLYFKEPTPEYKAKVRSALKTIRENKKKAKARLKKLKQEIKEKRKSEGVEEHLLISFIEELNALTGWLIAFYIIYYFISLYITTKDFGLTSVPAGLNVYKSQFFKYILAVLFLLHSATALKVNFFRKSILANIALPTLFVLGSLIALFNF